MAALRRPHRVGCNRLWRHCGGAVVTPAQISELTNAVIVLALVAGVVGAASYDLGRAGISALSSWLNRRQREQNFRDDMARIVAEIEGRPAPWPPTVRRIPFATKIALGVLPMTLVLSIYVWAVIYG